MTKLERFRRSLYPRLLHFGVSYGDLLGLERVLDRGNFSAWSAALSDLADEYMDMGREKASGGSSASASSYLRRACDYFHFATVRERDIEQRRVRRQRSEQCFRSWVAMVDSGVFQSVFSFNGTKTDFYHSRFSERPLVVLVGGLDSSKECELWYFSREFAKRGLDVAMADFPGQGSLHGKLWLLRDGDRFTKKLIDELKDRSTAQRIGVFGVSLGGYLALRSGAICDNVSAVVSLGGFFDSHALGNIWDGSEMVLREAFTPNKADLLSDYGGQISLQTAALEMVKPTLIIHGENDHLVSLDQVNQMASWAKESDVRIIAGGEHVATSKFSTLLNEMADWMAETLRENVG